MDLTRLNDSVQHKANDIESLHVADISIFFRFTRVLKLMHSLENVIDHGKTLDHIIFTDDRA